MDAPEQLTLDLEWPVYTHYTVELTKGAVGSMELVRTLHPRTALDAAGVVDAWRQTATAREGVTWQGDEVDERGLLYGLGPGGVVYCISCVPPLSEALAEA